MFLDSRPQPSPPVNLTGPLWTPLPTVGRPLFQVTLVLRGGPGRPLSPLKKDENRRKILGSSLGKWQRNSDWRWKRWKGNAEVSLGISAGKPKKGMPLVPTCLSSQGLFNTALLMYPPPSPCKSLSKNYRFNFFLPPIKFINLIGVSDMFLQGLDMLVWHRAQEPLIGMGAVFKVRHNFTRLLQGGTLMCHH